MMFDSQVAQRVIVRGPNGEIQITVLDGDPRIEFRGNPSSADPNAVIEYNKQDGTLQISTDYVRSGYGSLADTQPAWFVRVGNARGIMLDDVDDVLKATTASVLGEFPETWTLITSFSNGWTANAGAPPQYYRDPMGFIHLYGRLVPGGVIADGTVVMTLPSSARPSRNYFVPCMQDNAPYIRPGVEVQSGGDVRIFNYAAGNLVLDAVSFCLFQT